MIADDAGTCREQVEENLDFKYLASTVQGSKVQKKKKKEVWKPVEAERKRQREVLGVTWHGIK